jgi:hypothetical protein
MKNFGHKKKALKVFKTFLFSSSTSFTNLVAGTGLEPVTFL